MIEVATLLEEQVNEVIKIAHPDQLFNAKVRVVESHVPDEETKKYNKELVEIQRALDGIDRGLWQSDLSVFVRMMINLQKQYPQFARSALIQNAFDQWGIPFETGSAVRNFLEDMYFNFIPDLDQLSPQEIVEKYITPNVYPDRLKFLKERTVGMLAERQAV